MWHSNYLFLDTMDKEEKQDNILKQERIEKIYSRKKIKIIEIWESLKKGKTLLNDSLQKPQKGKFLNQKNGKNTEKLRKIIKILAILIIALIVFKTILNAVEPIIDTECITMAKAIATRISNEQATNVMAKYQYEDLTNIMKDENGRIKLISANIITVNQIISDIPILIQKELQKEENNKFYLKLGSFTGSKFFAGRGPDIEIKMDVNGNVETDLKSEFSSAGINQTLHRIYLEVRCEVSILTPFHTIERQIVNQVLLVEGVIVGEIPDTYYNLEGITQGQSLEVIH